MTRSPDDLPRASRTRNALNVLRAAEPQDRIAWSIVAAGGGVGVIAALVAIETVVRWIVTIVSMMAGWF